MKERAALLAPAVLLLAAVVGLPVARVIQLSFLPVDLTGEVTSGPTLAHHLRLWADGRWWGVLRTTLAFTAAAVAMETALGIAFALVLHRRFRGRGWARALVLLPWALPTAVMALAWTWIFNDAFGVLNDLLVRGGLLAAPRAWLGEPGTALAAMVVADVWKTTPFVTLVVLAGLQGIPEPLHEAARVDGLTPLQGFVRITLPLLVPSLVVAMVFRAVQSYGAFDLPYVLTGGGPAGSTETVSLYAYTASFRYLDFGFASAIAVQGMVLALVLAAALLRLARGPR